MVFVSSSDGVNYLDNPRRFNWQLGDPYRVYEQYRPDYLFEHPQSFICKETSEESKTSKEAVILLLPKDIITKIINYIPDENLLPLALVCKAWKKITFPRLFPGMKTVKNCTPAFERAMNKAARQGQLSLLWWLYTHQPMDKIPCMNSYGQRVYSDDRLVFRYTTPSMKVLVLYNAALGGHVAILEWLFKGIEGFDKTNFAPRFAKFDSDCKHDLTVLAAKSGRINVLWWLHQQGFSINSDTIEEAKKVNSPEVMQWLDREGYLKPVVRQLPCIRGSYEKYRNGNWKP